jgi:hypothetical protein
MTSSAGGALRGLDAGTSRRNIRRIASRAMQAAAVANKITAIRIAVIRKFSALSILCFLMKFQDRSITALFISGIIE